MNCKTSYEFSWLGCEFEASKAEGNNPQTKCFVNISINNTGFLNTMTKSSGKF